MKNNWQHKYVSKNYQVKRRYKKGWSKETCKHTTTPEQSPATLIRTTQVTKFRPQKENCRIVFRITNIFNRQRQPRYYSTYNLQNQFEFFIYLKFYFSFIIQRGMEVNCLCTTMSTFQNLVQKRLLLMSSSFTFKMNLLFALSKSHHHSTYQIINNITVLTS